MTQDIDPFNDWFKKLDARHSSTLTFQEIRRSLQALSRIYTQDRDRLAAGRALSGEGKRAAFALFYGPLHLLLIKEILTHLDPEQTALEKVLDLGCGTGVGGAAWGLHCKNSPTLCGVDLNAWALSEARWSYHALGFQATTHRRDAAHERIPSGRSGIIAAYTVNELTDAARAVLQKSLIRASLHGARVLIVEPIATSSVPWWDTWADTFAELGGRADTWSINLALPERIQLLAKAAGLKHRTQKARTLWLAPSANG